MHKSVFVYNSDYKIVPAREVTVEHEDIPVLEQPAAHETQKTEIENQNFVQTQTVVTAQPKVTTQNKPVKVQAVTTQTAPVSVQNNTVKVQSQTVKPQTTATKTTSPQIDLQKIVQNNKAIQNTKTVETTKNKTAPVQTKSVKQVQTAPAPKVTAQNTKTAATAPQPQKVLTAKEEEIAWNIWRSNLTNKIMEGTNFPYVPPGTVFRFEFDVDKYGKITNVHTWSVDSKYTPYAIQYMAPVIRNLQGRSILIFPEGTARTSTKAWGAWKISNRTILSTPDNYDDIEKVTR